MSGFDYRKEEWTRRKSYLLRSLFEDEFMLSTISEEDESVLQYSPNTSNENYTARHLANLDRSSSPLPNLIIEVVPRRPKIYDDEPEEHYKRLEKEMKKLYRRDYLNNSSCSSDNTELQSDYILHTYEDNNYCIPYLDSSPDVEKLKNDAGGLHVELSPANDESNVGNSIPSNSFGLSSKLETTLEEMDPSDNSNESRESDKVSSGDDRAYFANEEESEDGQSEEGHDEPMELTGNNDASSINDSLSTIPEPDVMRRQKTRQTLSAISNHDFEESPENIVLYQGKQLVFADESLNPDSNNIRDITGRATSTPNSMRESNCCRLSKRKSFSDRFEPYSSISISRDESLISKCNRALQTSFSDEENESLWRNFFNSTPIFLRLLS